MSRNEITGFVVAPALAPLTYLLILIVSSYVECFGQKSIKVNSIPDALMGIVGFTALGLPIVYFVTLVFAVPLYLLLRKVNCINVLSVSIGGAVIGVLPVAIVFPPEIYTVAVVHNIETLAYYGSFALSGYIAALGFWFITKKSRKNGT